MEKVDAVEVWSDLLMALPLFCYFSSVLVFTLFLFFLASFFFSERKEEVQAFEITNFCSMLKHIEGQLSGRSLLSSTDSSWNPGNSRNSGGIKFGRGACQIDQMILTQFRMEFKFRQNGSWNHPEWMNSRYFTEQNLVPLPQHKQCPATPKLIVSVCRWSIWAWSTTPNPMAVDLHI